MSVEADDLPRVEGVPDESYAALAGRYGHVAHDVLTVAREQGALAQPIVPGLPDLLAEAVHAARHEQARTVGDVLLRRTRLALLDAAAVSQSGGAVERVAAALGDELGWDERRRADETAAFAAERELEGVGPA